MFPITTFANRFLIAMPNMRDPDFVRGVALICQHSADGAMGVLINRLSEYRLGDVLVQMGIKPQHATVEDTPVLIGGPVQPERGFVLHSAEGNWESSYRISETLCMTTSRDVLAAMAEGHGPRRALVALGYAGWAAGQIENEIKQNAWLTADADARILFDVPLEHRWEAAAESLG
ncbi:MAG: YqgE/AlgH family protein, partial [Proteobacteria bacterium]|nr:YqgE/AlgH family protein [Pseudomonadota bacterium]